MTRTETSKDATSLSQVRDLLLSSSRGMSILTVITHSTHSLQHKVSFIPQTTMHARSERILGWLEGVPISESKISQ